MNTGAGDAMTSYTGRYLREDASVSLGDLDIV
jgi:hypothetical protein